MKLNFFTKSSTKEMDPENSSGGLLKRSATTSRDPKTFLRQVTIEEEPDSFDSVISNPSSFPITIVPNRQTSLYRYSNYSSSGNSGGGGGGDNRDFIRQNSYRSRLLRNSNRKLRRRAVFKNGDCNVIGKNMDKKGIRYLQDIFTTLVDSQWRWTLLIFSSSFVTSWLVYAVLWWLISLTHGDLEPMHLPEFQGENGWKPCVSQINSFTSCFLFSIETQTTIGYGSRATSEECPEGIFLMIFQSIWGVMMQTFMAGIVFAKMTRSKQRTQTLLFSKYAVICQRDGELNLMFRVGDMRKSHIIGASVRAQIIRTKATKEGEIIAQYQTELEICSDACGSDIFFIWPVVVVHKINQDSPLFNMSATDLLQDKFELVVVLEGTVESTGQTTQARSSYINTEVLWGHRFDPVVSYNKNRQSYEIDYSKFDETTQVDTPLCSAAELAEFYKLQDGSRTPDETTFNIRHQSINQSDP